MGKPTELTTRDLGAAQPRLRPAQVADAARGLPAALRSRLGGALERLSWGGKDTGRP